MEQFPKSKKTGLVLLGVTLASSLFSLSIYAIQSKPLPDFVREQAIMGVTSNADWEPAIRRFGSQLMALVPAGCFSMGSTDAQLEQAYSSCAAYYGAFGCQVDFSNEQPAQQVCFRKPFWIGITEVTNWQYALKMGVSTLSYQYSNLFWPRSGITWEQARDFCHSTGGRLPTEAEWEYAARGPHNLIYPFGNRFDLGKATLRKISPAPAGQNAKGVSWVGALDMSGGMAEWVSGWYGGFQSDGSPESTGDPEAGQRLVKGGSWFAHAGFLVRSAHRLPLSPQTANSTVGFRCVREYTP